MQASLHESWNALSYCARELVQFNYHQNVIKLIIDFISHDLYIGDICITSSELECLSPLIDVQFSKQDSLSAASLVLFV